MKRKMCAIVLCIVMSVVALTGCGEYELQENSNYSILKEKETFSKSKEDYLKDIETVMEMAAYLEYSGDDFDAIIETVTETGIFTKEGHAFKSSVIKIMELAKEGLELTNSMNENNFEEMLEQVLELKEELDELMVKATEEQLDDLLIAAKEAGVEAKDLQELGLDF